MPKKTTTKKTPESSSRKISPVPLLVEVQMSRELVSVDGLAEALTLAAQDGRRVLDELCEPELMQHDLLVETWVQKFEGAPDVLKMIVLVRINPFGRYGELTPAVVYIANTRAYTVLTWSGSFQRDVIGRTLAENRDRALLRGYALVPMESDQ